MNKTILKGNLTKDIELKDLGNDKKVANFSIAVRRDYKNQSGEYETDFFNCSAFGNTANFISKYFSRGSQMLLIGHLQNNQWETDSGEKRTATNVIVESVEFCGSKQQNNTNNNLEEFAENSGVNVNVIEGNDGLPF